MSPCGRCGVHERGGSGYCAVCRKLYQRGRARMVYDRKLYNLEQARARDPDATERAAIATGKLKIETHGYVNHNWTKLDKPKVVWARSAWDYVSDEEEASAHEECCRLE